MTVRLSLKVTICLIVCFFILNCTLVMIPPALGNNNPESFSTRQSDDDLEEVKVYFHRDNTMDTLYNDTIAPRVLPLNDGDEVEFTLNPELKRDLKVKGVNFAAKNGLEVWLDARTPVVGGDSTITINILENNDIIATDSFTILTNDAQTLFRIPFTDGAKEYHTFSKGSIIRINLSVSDAPVTIMYEDSSNNGYLSLYCDPIQENGISVSAHHRDGTTGAFYPNYPDEAQRYIEFRGTVKDAFGPYDVFNVTITMQGAFTGQEATYTYNAMDDDGKFSLEYTYPAGMTAKDYTYTAEVTINSGREFSKQNHLTMAEFGAYLECAEPNGEGVPNEVVTFEIDVYNIGGASDIIELVATPSPTLTGWVASFQGGSKTDTLLPGEVDTKTLEVTVSATAGKNEECEVEVKGIPSNNKNYYLNPAINVVSLPNVGFEFNPPAILEKQLPTNGGYADYEFTLRNVGQESDIYTVTGGSPSDSGWSAEFYSPPSTATKVSNVEYQIELESYNDAKFTYRVTAEPNPSSKLMKLDVQATGTNATEKIVHTTKTTIESLPGELKLSAVNDQTTKEVTPDKPIDENDTMSVTFNLIAENEDQIETFSVNLDLENLPNDWDYSFSSSNFNVGPEKDKSFSLTLTIPSTTEADANDRYQFSVIAKYGDTEANLGLKVTIPEVFDIEITAEETELEVEAGNTIIYELTVINKGNVVDEDVDITVTEIFGWVITISKPIITLGEYNTAISVSISITPSTDIESGEKGIVDVKVRVNGEIISNTINLKTTVKKSVDTELKDFFVDYWYIVFIAAIIIVFTLIIRSRMK